MYIIAGMRIISFLDLLSDISNAEDSEDDDVFMAEVEPVSSAIVSNNSRTKSLNVIVDNLVLPPKSSNVCSRRNSG